MTGEEFMKEKLKCLTKRRQIIIYILFIFIIIVLISQKKNIHVDEVYSYGLANKVFDKSIEMRLEDGVTYEDATTLWLEYMTAGEGHQFDYANVWLNQEIDVHPPLYYALLHTICSFFPGKFSIWYAGIINIIFAVFVLFMMRKLLEVMIEDTFLINAVSVFFICSAGVLDMTAFFRMYVMTLFITTTITYLFVKSLNEKYTIKFWITVGGVSVVGALTHYYFIVYLFFLCLVLGIYFLGSKMWKEAVSLVATMMVAGGISLMIFPPMIEHMFGTGQRGQQSMDNFKESSIEVFISRLKSFYGMLNDYIFGNMLTYIIVACILGMLIQWLTGECKNQEKKQPPVPGQKIKWVLLVLPGILYFVTVSKIAVYITERYQQPIYAVMITGIIALVYVVLKKVAQTQCRLILVLLLAVMILNSWKTAPWWNLHKSSEPLLAVAENHAALDCIYVYDAKWKIQPSFYDVKKYNSVTFFGEKSLNMLNASECRNNTEFILYITNSCDHQKVLDSVIASCPYVNDSEQLETWGYVTIYRMYSEGNKCNIQALDDSVQMENVYLMSVEDGYVNILVEGQALDVENGDFADGTAVSLFSPNGTAAQKWKIVDAGDGVAYIESANQEYCLTYDANGEMCITTKVANVVGQRWKVIY